MGLFYERGISSFGTHTLINASRKVGQQIDNRTAASYWKIPWLRSFLSHDLEGSCAV